MSHFHTATARQQSGRIGTACPGAGLGLPCPSTSAARKSARWIRGLAALAAVFGCCAAGAATVLTGTVTSAQAMNGSCWHTNHVSSPAGSAAGIATPFLNGDPWNTAVAQPHDNLGCTYAVSVAMMTSASSGLLQFAFDLGGTHLVDGLAYWPGEAVLVAPSTQRFDLWAFTTSNMTLVPGQQGVAVPSSVLTPFSTAQVLNFSTPIAAQLLVLDFSPYIGTPGSSPFVSLGELAARSASAPVPEPGGLALAGLALGVVALAQRRRRQAVQARLALGLAASLGAGVPAAQAAAVAYTGSVSSAQAFMPGNPCFQPSLAGDGSDLSQPPITDGVTPWSQVLPITHQTNGCEDGLAVATQGNLKFTLQFNQPRWVDALGYWAGRASAISGGTFPFDLYDDNNTLLLLGVSPNPSFGVSQLQTFGFFPATYTHQLILDFAPYTQSSLSVGELVARQAVPEPSALALLGLALVVMAWRGRRLRAPAPRWAVVLAASAAGLSPAAHAGYMEWQPGDPYVLNAPVPPVVVGNHAGASPTGNPNQVVGATTLGPTTSVLLRTHSNQNPLYAETEYELVWTLTNPFSTPMMSVSFFLNTFGTLLQYDGGPSGTVLDSVPWATQGSLVPGSWTAAGLLFDMGPGGLGLMQSATFHLPLDVLAGPFPVTSALSNVMATGGFVPLQPQAVPEPGALALLGLAGLVLGWQRRGRAAGARGERYHVTAAGAAATLVGRSEGQAKGDTR